MRPFNKTPVRRLLGRLFGAVWLDAGRLRDRVFEIGECWQAGGLWRWRGGGLFEGLILRALDG